MKKFEEKKSCENKLSVKRCIKVYLLFMCIDMLAKLTYGSLDWAKKIFLLDTHPTQPIHSLKLRDVGWISVGRAGLRV